jgi:hypothetical protein
MSKKLNKSWSKTKQKNKGGRGGLRKPATTKVETMSSKQHHQKKKGKDSLEGEDRNAGTIVPRWRLDEGGNYSDWTLEVSAMSREGKRAKMDVYHVHKVYLGSGPRSSAYFRTVFESIDFKEKQVSKTCLRFEPSAIHAFPYFLDYIYGCNRAMGLKPESAVALKYLANYLQVPSLEQSASTYIEGGLSHQNIHLIYKEALAYGDSGSLELCLGFISRLPRRHLLKRGCGNHPLTATCLTMQMLTDDQRIKVLEDALAYAEEETVSLQKRLKKEKIQKRKREVRPYCIQVA